MENTKRLSQYMTSIGTFLAMLKSSNGWVTAMMFLSNMGRLAKVTWHYPQTYYQAGQSYVKLGKNIEAIPYFQKFIEYLQGVS